MVPGALAAAAVAGEAPKLRQLKKACDGLEASFMKQLLSVMHGSVQEAKPVGDDTGMDNYKSMMDDAVAGRLAERGTLGISKMAFHATAGQVLNDALQKERP